MSLTLGGGPLSRPTPGTGDAPGQPDVALPAHLLHPHGAPLRLRALLGGEVVLGIRRGEGPDGDHRVDDVARTHPGPLDGARAVAGHLRSAGDGVEVLVDGTPAAS